MPLAREPKTNASHHVPSRVSPLLTRPRPVSRRDTRLVQEALLGRSETSWRWPAAARSRSLGEAPAADGGHRAIGEEGTVGAEVERPMKDAKDPACDIQFGVFMFISSVAA